MTKVLAQFLLIILAFFLSFAVASQAVLYPNSKMNPLLAFHILKRPFWSVFGEFSLDDFDSPTECTGNPLEYNTYAKLRCPSESGIYYVPVLMGIYVIIVNILLFNLLIALFNIDIHNVERTAEELWNLHFHLSAKAHIHIKQVILKVPSQRKTTIGTQTVSMKTSRSIRTQTVSVSKHLEDNSSQTDVPYNPPKPPRPSRPDRWMDMYGRVVAFPVSAEANIHFNARDKKMALKKYFAVKSKYRYGTKWNFHGIRLIKRRSKKNNLWEDGYSRTKSAASISRPFMKYLNSI
ncbi:Transient receptor putative cation channel sub M member 3 [Bulinus truncatus]|nr:Transient receptor putative cation channel sub M member 3 [Bulinus truncatus]